MSKKVTAAEVAESRKRMDLISSVVPGSKKLTSAIEQLMKEEEVDDLKRTLEERKQTLQNLKLQQMELQKSIEEVKHQYEIQVLRSEEVQQKVERVQEANAETEKLKEENATLMKRKEELQREIETYSPYRNFLEEVCKISGHKNADEFAAYYSNMLILKENLVKERKQRQEEKEQLTKELQTLKKQKTPQWLQRTNELAKLEKELEEAQYEVLKWETKWGCIQRMEEDRALNLCRVKFSIQNTYELCGYKITDLDVDDTARQLKEIKTFIQDQIEIVKQYQKSLQS